MVTERIKNITPSATCELEGTVAELEAAGVHVIGLNAGEPDFRTPDNIVEACDRAIAEGKTKYVSITGIPELKRAICAKLEKDNGVHYEPNCIAISTGAKQALYNGIMTVVEPGDEVIIPIPAWVSYVEMVKLAQGVPVLCDLAEDYQLDLAEIEKSITPKTKAIIINTPNNPTGGVYTEESLRALADLAVKHDFFIISDEVYEKLIYNGKKHFCVASVSPEVRDRTILINGFSKAYAMTGWRIGYSATTPELCKGISDLQGHTTSNSTTFVQWAALEALTGQQETVEYMRTKFVERREYLYKRLAAMPGIECQSVDGAFYLFPDVSSYFGKSWGKWEIKTSTDLCAYLLDEAHLAVVPGDAFYAPKKIRIAYSNSLENIREGMDAREAALAKLK
ncbi:MAG: pyridoxal phosphate-dependent aminotransferase [Firmicutes bacterium]|nr:pyridoxal phosphate-dependent aminotransferase [Bacillota bacterium]